VLELLSGALPDADASALTLEIPLFDGPEAIQRLRAAGIGSERVLFLRNKGASAADAGMSAEAQAADAGFYRLTSLAAEILEADGFAVVPEDERDVLAPLAAMDFERAIRLVRAAAD
jgi:hypothetical protein